MSDALLAWAKGASRRLTRSNNQTDDGDDLRHGLALVPILNALKTAGTDMRLGYQAEINTRFGGHGGHDTEFEITTRSNTARVKNLECMGIEGLVEFHYNDNVEGFCVLQGGYEQLAYACVDYLSCWPNREIEKLKAVLRLARSTRATINVEPISDPIQALGELLEEAGLTTKIGLRQQGHLPLISAMLGADASWEQIGRAVGWAPTAAKEWWDAEEGNL